MGGLVQPLLQESEKESLKIDLNDFTQTVKSHGTRQVYFQGFSRRLFQSTTFCSNRIVTSKYTAFNFLAKFLGVTFSTASNVYFLLICFLQVMPGITNTFGVPTQLFPLLFVILVDAVFQIVEDTSRHQADEITNTKAVDRWNPISVEFEQIQSQNVHVGDIIRVRNEDPAPADLVLIGVQSSSCEGNREFCYVETRNLDGETNLKMRDAMVCTSGKKLNTLAGEIQSEQPNGSIHTFKGLMVTSAGSETIGPSNVILRGCIVRNTTFIYGVVVYTGHDTKIMQAANDCPSKESSINHRINSEFVIIVGFLILFCAIAATIAVLFNIGVLDESWYLPLGTNSFVVWFATFLRFFLILSNMVPISLYVTLDVVKSIQSYFMQNDLHMYHHETDTPCSVRTMALNEDLGQISHVFTDKTGTLTCNVMNFRKCCINGTSYSGDAAQAKSVSPWVNFEDAKFLRDLNRPNDERRVNEFLWHLSLNHTIVTERVSEGQWRLSASSPDEQALVAMAKKYGFEFLHRSPGKATIKIRSGETVEYDILNVLEFNSTRKRMSVVVQDPETREIKILSKGADSVIFPRLVQSAEMDLLRKQTQEQLEKYAKEGLRTLILAQRNVSQEEYDAWNEKYKAIGDNSSELEKVIEELETELELLGATAIEDELQSGVEETIELLRGAGICVWMLTGDHPDTAQNIATSSKLIDSTTKCFNITSQRFKKMPDIRAEILKRIQQLRIYRQAAAMRQATSKSNDVAVILDGESLNAMFHEIVVSDFLELVELSDIVLACRISPGQKADLVRIVRAYTTKPGRTLAIGDGANDVPMIQAAHVGVGISGNEGLQAANSSDYSIAQFRFLRRLLFVHGRFNYRRISLVVCYIFYKNILLVMSQFWYSLVNGMSGQKFYNEWAVNLFNTLYTAAPIVVVGVNDMDVPAWISQRIPILYRSGILGHHFDRRIFWCWIIGGLIESCAICMVAVLVLNTTAVDGSTYGMWEDGALTFTLVIVVVNLKLALYQSRWTILEVWFSFLSIALWFISAFILSSAPDINFNWFDLFPTLLQSNAFWFALLLTPVVTLFKDILIQGYIRNWYPQPEHIIQERLAFNRNLSLQDFEDTNPNLFGFKAESPRPAAKSTGFALAFDPRTSHEEAGICVARSSRQ